MPTPVQMASHDKKCNVPPYYDHLDLINAMMPFTKPLVSSDANTSNSGITSEKGQVALHFDVFQLTNVVMPMTMTSASHDINAITKKAFCTFLIIIITKQTQWCH